MPPLTFILAVLLALIQYPLWWGHGGWRSVHRLEHQLTGQQRIKARLKQSNEQYAGEVRDLEQGTAGTEERPRYEAGMVKEGEVFVQFVFAAGQAQTHRVTPCSGTTQRRFIDTLAR